MHGTVGSQFWWVIMQATKKTPDKSKAKAVTSAAKAQTQAAVPAGASALARSLFGRKANKGGEAVPTA